MEEEVKIKKRDQKVVIGNKLINVYNLSKNRVSMRYNDNSYVKGKGMNRAITTDLKKIIQDVIEKNKYEITDYNKLEDAEKEYLDQLFDFCKIGILSHKYQNDKENDKDIKRFNLLKSSILSGNDSRELLKEFKLLLFKLKSKNLISTHSFNHLITQLVILGI
jgi:hypothetical protein